MKPMNLKKRIASTVLAGSMALSMTATAFAVDPTTTITGAYTPITLAVTVPTTGRAIINPYGLPYKLDDTTSISGQYITTGAPLVIQNKSAVALSVSASIIGVEVGQFKFDASPIADSETDNKGNVVFQMFPAPGVTDSNVTDTDVLNPLFAALNDDTAGHDAAKDIVVSKTDPSTNPAASEDDIIVLKQGNADGELQDGGAAFFRLSGTVAKKPTVAWTASDGFSAKVTFTFAPSVYPEDGGTIAADNGNTTLNALLTNTEDVTLTPALPSNVTVDTWAWTSSNTSAATVAVNNTNSTKATVSYVAAGSATITATGTGSDGNTYVATIDFTCS